MKLLELSLLILFYANNVRSNDWTYERGDPYVWFKKYKECAGEMQSPINIQTDNLLYDSSLKSFNFIDYNQLTEWNVLNNGRTITITPIIPTNITTALFGSNFIERFKLIEFHFHWGYNEYHGSEHLIDNKKFPLELHIVHQSSKGKLTVLGFLFEVIDDTDNENLNRLLGIITEIKNANTSKNDSFKLSDILPDLNELSDYYRYTGSLTTPPCTEGVIWNIMVKKIKISLKQMQVFRMDELTSNFRDPQPYKEVIYSSFYDCSNLSSFIRKPLSFKSFEFSKVMKCKFLNIKNFIKLLNSKKNI